MEREENRERANIREKEEKRERDGKIRFKTI